MFLEKEKKQTLEETARADKHKDECSQLRKVNWEIHDLYKQIGSMAGTIGEELLPATQKIVDLKVKLHELYIMLGKDNDQATFETLKDAKEFDRIGPSVTNIVRAGTIKRELREKEEESSSLLEEPDSSTNQIAQTSTNKPAAAKKQKKQTK